MPTGFWLKIENNTVVVLGIDEEGIICFEAVFWEKAASFFNIIKILIKAVKFILLLFLYYYYLILK